MSNHPNPPNPPNPPPPDPQRGVQINADRCTRPVICCQPRLINPSPPRAITPGNPFIPYDADPPHDKAAVERLVSSMSQQSLEPPYSHYRLSRHYPSTTRPLEPLPNPFPYPLELEIDPESDNIESWASLVVVNPITLPPPPPPYIAVDEKETISSSRRLLSMINNKTQCNVHGAPQQSPPLPPPPPLPTTTTTTTTTTAAYPPLSQSIPQSRPGRFNMAMPPPPPAAMLGGCHDAMEIEIDPNPEANTPPYLSLQVDENCNEEELSWMETSLMTLRRAAAPGGVRKHGLRYRVSSEAAMRCPNLVRSVPRMRRRKDKSKSSKGHKGEKDKDKDKRSRDVSTTTAPAISTTTVRTTAP